MTKFNCTPDEIEIIEKIVSRITGIGDFDPLSIMMDIEATHCNGCPLNLDKLLKSDESSFYHDLSGISGHLNRSTGKLEYNFLPRCSAE